MSVYFSIGNDLLIAIGVVYAQEQVDVRILRIVQLNRVTAVVGRSFRDVSDSG
jgi:hypothetical protein